MKTTSNTNLLIDGVIHSNPGIGKFSTETLKAYHESGSLRYMFTTLVFHPEHKLLKYTFNLFPFLRIKLKNRYFTEIPSIQIKVYPLKEICRLFAVKFLSLTAANTIWQWAELSFDKWVADRLDGNVKLLHCYEHAALSTFKEGKRRGCFKILEQTSQHHSSYKKMVEQQFKAYPGLRSEYYEKIFLNNLKKNNKRKNEEYELADLIICNSTFTMNTLIDAGIKKNKIIKIPLAYPKTSYIKKKTPSNQFTFICVGSISLTKGTHILLEVWRKHFFSSLSVKLILAGSISIPKEFIDNLPRNIELKGFINKLELDELYNQADLLVFPTLADGFGMVITEAMAKGLPVLTTNNSAGYDLIEDNVDGFIVDAGNADALAEKMLWIIKHKSILTSMSKLILNKAKAYQWEDYRALLINIINERYRNYLNE